MTRVIQQGNGSVVVVQQGGSSIIRPRKDAPAVLTCPTPLADQITSERNNVLEVGRERTNVVKVVTEGPQGAPGEPGAPGGVNEIVPGENVVVDAADPAKPTVSVPFGHHLDSIAKADPADGEILEFNTGTGAWTPTLRPRKFYVDGGNF